jgi:hypothetical protein
MVFLPRLFIAVNVKRNSFSVHTTLFTLCHKVFLLPAGILSGLGEGLAKDDDGDRKEWFTFKKKSHSPEPSTTTKSTHTAVNDTEGER